MSKMIKRGFSKAAYYFKKITVDSLKGKNKSVSSQQWLARQLSDPYVEKAKQLNLRCRSAFKLIEIDDRFSLLKPGSIVIDCGAAPGSWSQVAAKRVNSNGSDNGKLQGKVIAIDRQQVYPIEGVTIVGNKDFTSKEAQESIKSLLGLNKADVVLSDMAPAATGIKSMDDENILKLCYAVLRFAVQNTKVDGSVLVKLWQSGGTKELEENMRRFYENVRIVKPSASRSDSAEIFLLGRNFKGLKDS